MLSPAFGQRVFLFSMLAALAALALPCHAHLMAAQHGTLNIKGSAVYLVLSLPVSAFEGCDDDGDGRMSLAELQRHRATIERRVIAGLLFGDGTQQVRPIDALLSLSPTDDQPDQADQPAPQLIVLAVAQFDKAPQRLLFSTDLFGRNAAEDQLHITATRGLERQTAVLSPSQGQGSFFSSPWRSFVDALRRRFAW